MAWRRTKAEWALVHTARCKAWSGSLTTTSLVTPRSGRSRSIDGALSVALSGGAPTRQWGQDHEREQGESENPGAKKDRRPHRLPAELSRVNLNAAGIDVGASSHFAAVPQDRWEQPVREFEAFTADLYRLADGWWSVRWRPWPWSPPGFTGYLCSRCWRSGGLR